MTRPVLGIICCTRWVGVEHAQAVINRYVVAAMRHADAAALLVPSVPELMRAREVAPRLDGLLLTGSPSNIEPDHYGQAGAPDAAGPFDPPRDSMTFDLIQAMIAAKKPVFGICRGFQELNVALGGTLRRDTNKNRDLLIHHAPDDVSFGAMFDHFHTVNLTDGGLLAAETGKKKLTVNSVHFQGVDALAPGLCLEAQAPDGLAEAFSSTLNGAPVLAVQWHPEWDADRNPDAQAYYRLLGRALRGEGLSQNQNKILQKEERS